ncbi:hypothetical protein K3495_g704 [Podosphaera aphanis]|nr:hypothetical protein K3495_g704 [Podosphaera aphanis]
MHTKKIALILHHHRFTGDRNLAVAYFPASIGAGPVGLDTAGRISDEFKNVEIKVFDPLRKYNREQEISLSGWRPPPPNFPLMEGNYPIMNIEEILKDELRRRLGVLSYIWEYTDVDSLINPVDKARKLDVIIFAKSVKTTVPDQYLDGSDVSRPFGCAVSVHDKRVPGLKAKALSYADTYRVTKLIDVQLYQDIKNRVDVSIIMLGPHTKDQFRRKMNPVIKTGRVELGEQLVTRPSVKFASMNVSITKRDPSRYKTIELYPIGDAAATLPY